MNDSDYIKPEDRDHMNVHRTGSWQQSHNVIDDVARELAESLAKFLRIVSYAHYDEKIIDPAMETLNRYRRLIGEDSDD